MGGMDITICLKKRAKDKKNNKINYCEAKKSQNNNE